MGAGRIHTGNTNADRVLAVVLARIESLPPSVRQDLRDGVRSLPLQYAFLVGQTQLDSVEVHLALEHLHEHAYLAVDFGYPGGDDKPCRYNVNVWPLARLESAA